MKINKLIISLLVLNFGWFNFLYGQIDTIFSSKYQINHSIGDTIDFFKSEQTTKNKGIYLLKNNKKLYRFELDKKFNFSLIDYLKKDSIKSIFINYSEEIPFEYYFKSNDTIINELKFDSKIASADQYYKKYKYINNSFVLVFERNCMTFSDDYCIEFSSDTTKDTNKYLTKYGNVLVREEHIFTSNKNYISKIITDYQKNGTFHSRKTFYDTKKTSLIEKNESADNSYYIIEKVNNYYLYKYYNSKNKLIRKESQPDILVEIQDYTKPLSAFEEDKLNQPIIRPEN